MVTRRVVWLIGISAFLIVLLLIPRTYSSAVRRVCFQLISPLVRLEHLVVKPFSALRNLTETRRQLRRENIVLKARVKELSRGLMTCRQMEEENRRLRSLLEFKQRLSHEYSAAEVIGRDPQHWFRSVIIDKGRAEGVHADMVVVNEDGVIGKVIESAATASKVLLLVDKRSRIGGIVERTREEGVVEGTSFNTCRLRFLPGDAKTKEGDRVYSSGLGGIYPEGLYIGLVEKVFDGEHGLYRYADISPGVDTSRLEEVLILIDGDGREMDEIAELHSVE